jgi:uncharacterized RDD family membrane protein YckC
MPYCKNCGSELSPDAQFCQKCGTPVTTYEQAAPSGPEPFAAPGLKLAFWGERFVAWLIDAIIIGIFAGALEWSRVFAWEPLGFWPSWFPLFNLGTGGLLYFLYWLLMDGAYGQSVGKMVMRIRIVRLDGGRINMGQAAIESVGKAFLLFLDVLIGWLLYPKRRQRAFNYLSETIVIQDRRA